MLDRTSQRHQALERVARHIVDLPNARIIVPADRTEPGSWFGGGNMWQAPDGALYLVGRYRNPGDSRTGVAAGARGFALAAFRSTDGGETFEKIWQLDKEHLSPENEPVVSIEGAALFASPSGVELLVSSEKGTRSYPESVASFQKPGTGVWTIDRLAASSVESLPESSIEPLLWSDDEAYLHVKDPFFVSSRQGSTWLGVCTHPFGWSSSNTVMLPYTPGDASPSLAEGIVLPRGAAWDVAITRVTSMVDLAWFGLSEADDGEPAEFLVFYDGGECVRDHEQHPSGVHRPRGFSCEELAGIALWREGSGELERISRLVPAFVSPHGTGCCRYVDVLRSQEGSFATWQQAAEDGSQPLMFHSTAPNTRT